MRLIRKYARHFSLIRHLAAFTAAAAVATGHAHAIDRSDYLSYIDREYRTWAATYVDRLLSEPPGKYNEYYAVWEAFYYRISDKPEHAARATALLRGAYIYSVASVQEAVEANRPYYTDPNLLDAALTAYTWIRASSALSPLDHETIRHFFTLLGDHLYRERGAMNRSMAAASCLRRISYLYPDDPRSEERKIYYDAVWNDWWPHRDTNENSLSYNAVFLQYVHRWVEETSDDTSFFSDAGFRAFADRLRVQATPFGPMPDYGDTVGFNSGPGAWISILETWARHFRDGRFTWVAHRIFEWSTDRYTDMHEWGNIVSDLARSLMSAYFAADPTLTEVAPNEGDLLTFRKAVRWTTLEERAAGLDALELTSDTIPDKAIMRSGTDPHDLYLIANLTPPLGHGHYDTACIDYLFSEKTALLIDTPYLIKDHRFHNCLIAIPSPDPIKVDLREGKQVQATLFSDEMAAVTVIEVPDYQKLPVNLIRTIFRYRDSIVWVIDDLLFTETVTNISIGPAWQVGQIDPRPAHQLWVNTRFQSIPLSFIWELRYLLDWTIPNTLDLFILFQSNSTTAQLQIDDVRVDSSERIVHQPLQNNLNERVWYREHGTILAGTNRRFMSVLVPHRRGQNPELFSQSIELSDNADNVSLLRMATGDTHSVLLGVNPQRRQVDVAGVSTEAIAFAAELDNGTPIDVWKAGTHTPNPNSTQQLSKAASISRRAEFGDITYSGSCQVSPSAGSRAVAVTVLAMITFLWFLMRHRAQSDR